jgi:anti-sigma-K factor RskA
MSGPSLSERGPHDEAEELLPWYATGQLDAAERARVERHLYACASCREQLALERRFIDRFQATSPEVESGWARIKARVQPPRPVAPPQPGFFADLRSLVSRPAFAALAAAQLAFVVVSGATLMSLSRPEYRALGSAPVPADGNVIVIFRADASQERMRAALHSAGASIVGGPTDADAYLLHVDPRQRQAALARLQSDDLVEMAQPIDGAAQ